MTLLSTRVTKRCGAHQGLSRIRPTIRMRVRGVGDLQRVRHAGCTSLGRIAIAALEKTPRHDTQPPCHLVEPCAVWGGQVEPMRRGRIAQERAPLCPSAPRLGHARHTAPLGDQTADLEAPVGLEILHPPVVALHLWPWVPPMGQRPGTIGAGARLAQMPDDLTRCHDKRGDQCPSSMPDGLVLAFFRFAGCPGLCGVCALQNLPPRLCIAANDHTARRTEAQGVEG
jgi:hypothetical protein